VVLKVLFLGLLVIISLSGADILSSDRRTAWTPGIPGGIPAIASPVLNVIDYGADSKGLIDCADVVVKAINALPSGGGIIYFPQGIYLFKSTISIARNDIVFRGDGIGKTRLLHDHSGLCFDVVTYKRGGWQNISSGGTAGSFSVTVENGSKFVKGGFAEIRQANDSSLMYTDPEWIQSWADSAVGQLFEVAEINGNVITFRNLLHFSFNQKLSLQIRPQGFITNVGFENFSIECLQSDNSTFQFKNAAYCWVKNIESYHTRKSHITNNTTLGCEFRDSYFHRSFSYGDGGSGYGVEFGYHCTDGLCENNVFDSLRHAMMVQVGTSGTVFGYNYSVHPIQGDGESNLNNGWSPPDISLHGHYAQMNLFEGNVVQEIGVGDYWGPMGPGNTFLRNVVHGEGVFLYDHSHKQNFVGNKVTKWTTDSTSDSIFRHGESVNGALFWDYNTTDHAIPVSYYLKQKPAFYGNIEWPSTGSDQSDVKLPAIDRFRTSPQSNSQKINVIEKPSPTKISVLRKNLIRICSPLLLSGGYSIEIVTSDGRLIKNSQLISNPGEMIVRIDGCRVMPGVYIFSVQNHNWKESIKFLY
jgi:hypothetical protein